jgi:septum formation protein
MEITMDNLILASASPRRAKILRQLGLDFSVVIPEVEEVMYIDDSQRTVRVNAKLKLLWCRERNPHNAIIAADTVVDLAGRCITKPESMDEAFAMISKMTGRTHTVYTGVAMWRPGDELEVIVCETKINFKKLNAAEIKEYFMLVDPLDKAGAYDADQYGELLIASYEGSHTNIMGLPREVIKNWLKII